MLKVKLITVDTPNIDLNEQFLLDPRSDIYGFINSTDKFYTDDAIDEIIKIFEKGMDQIGIVYSDKYLRKNGKLIPQIYPSFESGRSTIYNPTIFVNGNIRAAIFDPQLKHLRNYDVIMKISTACKIIHIPKFLLVSELIQENIDQELQYYVRKNS